LGDIRGAGGGVRLELEVLRTLTLTHGYFRLAGSTERAVREAAVGSATRPV
jgi:hypothetical protein